MLSLGTSTTTSTGGNQRQILPLKLIYPSTTISPKTLIAGS